jgi:DNA-binding SARP family transcriptional activator
MRNLTITVHRLRRALQFPHAVLQHDGKLTLNHRVCWVDAWGFESLVNDGLHRISEDPAATTDAESKLRTAVLMYEGKFLGRESEEGWMLSPRLRLEIKFERLVAALCRHLEEGKRYADAIDLCRMALERDPLNETLYRRLMSCNLKAGELAEVVRIYRRCWEALSKGLAAQPSEQTQRLYLEGLQAAAIRGGQPAAHHHRHGHAMPSEESDVSRS